MSHCSALCQLHPTTHHPLAVPDDHVMTEGRWHAACAQPQAAYVAAARGRGGLCTAKELCMLLLSTGQSSADDHKWTTHYNSDVHV